MLRSSVGEADRIYNESIGYFVLLLFWKSRKSAFIKTLLINFRDTIPSKKEGVAFL